MFFIKLNHYYYHDAIEIKNIKFEKIKVYKIDHTHDICINILEHFHTPPPRIILISFSCRNEMHTFLFVC